MHTAISCGKVEWQADVAEGCAVHAADFTRGAAYNYAKHAHLAATPVQGLLGGGPSAATQLQQCACAAAGHCGHIMHPIPRCMLKCTIAHARQHVTWLVGPVSIAE